MKTTSFLVLIVIFVVAVSCSSVKVVTDQDKNTDFSAYKTYNFLGWQDGSDKILNDFDKQRIHEAFKKEFDARGMELVKENGDMAVSLFLVIDQKTSTTAYTNYYTGGYGGYYRFRGGWGYGYTTTTYSEEDYLEGTLVMDVFDGKSKNQVWQGVAKSTVDDNPNTRDKTIPKKVAALMKKFPVQPVN
ncbi:MAG: DUF4136 domain-containing protein [Bacteroidetes bacterium]|nr:MAG: DUF4136 domain-containing protein [Bacteroidota bacterium]